MNKLEWYEAVADIIEDNLEEFYNQFYESSELDRVGKNYRLQPCPQCLHNDCCTIGIAVHCFSCDWSGTHIDAWFDYATNNLGISLGNAIKKIEEFTNIKFPQSSPEDIALYEKARREQEILRISEAFYHKQLLNNNKNFKFNGKGITPLNYLKEIRNRKESTIKDLKVGFSSNYPELKMNLKEAGFSDEEIKAAKVWIPDGLFIFFYKHYVTKDIIRINTKNPFEIKEKIFDEFGNAKEGNVIKGYSTGNKAFLYSPNFSFKKPFAMVEGEHDMAALLENGCNNVICIGGNVPDNVFSILDKAENRIYACFDNDQKGKEYTDIVNKLFPDKNIYKVIYEGKDPDEFFVSHNTDCVKWDDLADRAIQMQTEKFRVKRRANVWTAANRFKKLEFEIKKKNDKGHLIGQATLVIDGELEDRQDEIVLIKCKAKMKPMNFILSDAISEYFNSNFDKRTTDELIEIYWNSLKKGEIISTIAQRIYGVNQEQQDNIICDIKNKTKNMGDASNNFIDSILKELNDIQNKNVIRYSGMPKIKISQYFNMTNDDGYFYFTMVKSDGDTIRKLPYLLRNDKTLIRLDLLKRKDIQCLLLIDNKYELPSEIETAVFELDTCSLQQEYVDKYISGELDKEKLSPAFLVKKIEEYIKRFYYTDNPDTYKVLALFCYFTYYYEVFGKTPYVYLTGEKGAGKSVLDSVLKMFCFNTRLAVDMSEASLFRLSAIEGGTVILDEMENMTSRKRSQDSTMASILKGGYTRNSPVMRFNAEKGCIEEFDTFCPKIISNIFGLEDVISDRCIPILSYRLTVTKETKKEDPKIFSNENLAEIKEITSYCCLSALDNFQKLYNIYNNSLFQGTEASARLIEILTPVLAIAKLADFPQNESTVKNYPDMNIYEVAGDYENALRSYYEIVILPLKREIENSTPEGAIKEVVKGVAKELYGLIPHTELEYIDPNYHKYKDKIEFNREEGWFELNAMHFKCFMEEHSPGDTYYLRQILGQVRRCFNKFKDGDIKRKIINVENDELKKEFKGNTKPKVFCYRFYFRDVIDPRYFNKRPQNSKK